MIDLKRVSRSVFARLLVLMLSLLLFASFAGAQGGGTGTLSGVVYDDANGNGVRDIGESGIANHEVSLIPTSDIVPATHTFTDASGRYALDFRLDVEYSLQPAWSSEYVITQPAVGGSYAVFRPSEGNRIFDFGIHKPCVKIKLNRILCVPGAINTYTLNFTITNCSNFPIKYIYLYPPTGTTFTPQFFNLAVPLPVNGTQTLQTTITGLTAGTDFCFQITFHSATLAQCCEERICFVVPPCDCFQITEDMIDCKSDGSFTWNFCMQNLYQGAPTVNQILFAADTPSNVNFTPPFLQIAPLGYGGIYCGSVNISGTGLSGGQTVCFYMAIYAGGQRCCSRRICLVLPECPMGCQPCPGECWAGKPRFSDQNFAGFVGTVAVVTCTTFNPNDPVMAVQNLDSYQTTPPPLNFNWAPIPFGFHNEYTGTVDDRWTAHNMGTLFGLTLDRGGNIYTTQCSYVSGPALPSATYWNPVPKHGTIYRVDAVTAKPTVFAVLQPTANGCDLGNISFDGDHANQFFVTNFEDGKIYRLSSAGVTLSTFDPLSPDATALGVPAPRGERLWAVQYHCDRVYYGVWVEDVGNGNPNASNNIRSVGVDGSGNFIPASDRWECDIPDLPISVNWGIPALVSSPPSDISFSPEGRMMVATRGSYDHGTYAHKSAAHEYECRDGKFQLRTATYLLGGIFNPGYNACGGVDYDYNPNFTVGNADSGRRVWFTVDAVTNNGLFTYGLQGVPITGGSSLNSIAMDIDGAPGGKSTLCDVEIPCPQLPLGPSGFNVAVGSLFSGGLNDLVSSDNLCLAIFSDSESLEAAVVIYTVTNVPSPHFISFTTEVSATRTGLAQEISWLDYATGSYESLDAREATTVDTVIQVQRSADAAHFVSAAGEMRVQIRWTPINDEDPSQDGWILSVDKASWVVAP